MSAEKETERAAGFTPGPWKSDGCLVIAPGFILATVNWHSGYEHGVANARLMAAAPDLYEALSDLVEIIERAGISNLANGVQLGQMSWAVKAGDRMRWAKTCLAKATPPCQERANPSPPHASPRQGA